MNSQRVTRIELASLLTSYCNVSVHAEREGRQGDLRLVHNTAKAAAVVARARGCSTEDLFTAFELAWKREPLWGALPPAAQTAAYDRALSLLTGLFLDE